MSRNWGLPSKDERMVFRDAKVSKPLLTFFVTAVFGVIGAAVAVISFGAARDAIAGLFHGGSLIAAVAAASFGCWLYIWLARPRFAAQFAGKTDAFSNLIRFYARASIALSALMAAGLIANTAAPMVLAVALLCMSGGAGAAAAFQTVLTFVPYYEDPNAKSASGD